MSLRVRTGIKAGGWCGCNHSRRALAVRVKEAKEAVLRIFAGPVAKAVRRG